MFPISVSIVAIFFIGAGVLHFVLLDFFSSIVPPYLSNPEALVKISGVFEVLCIAVLPANIHMAMNPDQFASIPVLLLYLRLPLQGLIIWLIWRAGRAGGYQKS
jgi:uncharacterized membrane protein